MQVLTPLGQEWALDSDGSFHRATVPGIYEVKAGRDSAPRLRFSANPPPGAGDLRRLDAAALKRITGAAAVGGLLSSASGVPLWPWILASMFLLLAAETWVLFRNGDGFRSEAR